MKSITIHNLDEELYSMIRESAKANRRSMNQEIKDKLSKTFFPDTEDKKLVSFKKFLSIWNENDYKEFTNNTIDFEKTSESEWNL